MILDIVLAKIFTGFAIVSAMFFVVSIFEQNIDHVVYALGGIVLFANLAGLFVNKAMRD